MGIWNGLDILSVREIDNYSKLTRNSATQLQVESQDSLKDYIVINKKVIDLSTPIVCNLSGNLIDSNGADAGSAPGASTLYYAYLSNSIASYAPYSLRLSATVPTDEYLGTSGNAKNWRFVGALYCNASTQIANDLEICGYAREDKNIYLTSDFTRSSGSEIFYDITNLSGYCVILDNSYINIFASMRSTGSSFTFLRVLLDNISIGHQGVYGWQRTCVSGIKKYTTIQRVQYTQQYLYPLSAITIYGNYESRIDNTFINIVRAKL